MKKIISIITVFLLIVVLTGCSNSSNISEITYNELDKLIKDKETFILEIKQTGCSNCEAFAPKFDSVLKENNIKAKSINTSNISEEDNAKLSALFNITGTPTVIFINKGQEEFIYQRIVGNVSKDVITTKLTSAGYIKEK